jgi:hypothetical protein
MNHFYETIDGWFNAAQLYKGAVEHASDGAVFVEVGAWKGKSAAYMCVEILNSNKDIKFHVVDYFQGSKEHEKEDAIVNGTLKQEFLKNTERVSHAYRLHDMTSLEAAQLFADGSLDFVYIDASHEYEDVKADIQAWLPKMKRNAILSGDDFDIYQGVNKAVEELLPGFELIGVNWMYRT